jgi:hypothetical protein
MSTGIFTPEAKRWGVISAATKAPILSNSSSTSPPRITAGNEGPTRTPAFASPSALREWFISPEMLADPQTPCLIDEQIHRRPPLPHLLVYPLLKSGTLP